MTQIKFSPYVGKMYDAYIEAKKDGIISNDEKAILESLKILQPVSKKSQRDRIICR